MHLAGTRSPAAVQHQLHARKTHTCRPAAGSACSSPCLPAAHPMQSGSLHLSCSLLTFCMHAGHAMPCSFAACSTARPVHSLSTHVDVCSPASGAACHATACPQHTPCAQYAILQQPLNTSCHAVPSMCCADSTQQHHLCCCHCHCTPQLPLLPPRELLLLLPFLILLLLPLLFLQMPLLGLPGCFCCCRWSCMQWTRWWRTAATTCSGMGLRRYGTQAAPVNSPPCLCLVIVSLVVTTTIHVMPRLPSTANVHALLYL
jgi:hypothetical protein